MNNADTYYRIRQQEHDHAARTHGTPTRRPVGLRRNWSRSSARMAAEAGMHLTIYDGDEVGEENISAPSLAHPHVGLPEDRGYRRAMCALVGVKVEPVTDSSLAVRSCAASSWTR